jgi:hypothetical protein
MCAALIADLALIFRTLSRQKEKKKWEIQIGFWPIPIN